MPEIALHIGKCLFILFYFKYLSALPNNRLNTIFYTYIYNSAIYTLPQIAVTAFHYVCVHLLTNMPLLIDNIHLTAN